MPDSLKVFLTSPVLDIELKLIGLLVLFLGVRAILGWLSGQIGRRLDVRVSDPDRRARLRTLLKAGRDVAVGIVLIGALADVVRALGLVGGGVLARFGVVGLGLSGGVGESV